MNSQRMYEGAKGSRLMAGMNASTTSGDTEIVTSLTRLRARSRALGRDVPYARRAKKLIKDNIIGSGVMPQAQVESTRGGPRKNINDSIEAAFLEWCKGDSCHTGGVLHFCDLQRALMDQIPEAGEVFIRIHRRPFGKSQVPIALELVESERVPHELNPSFQTILNPTQFRAGIEMDDLYRPIAYYVWERHPGDLWPLKNHVNQVIRVPAADIIHLHIVNRWPQTRGVPWFHTTLKKLNDMDGYSDAEITAARGAANYMGWLNKGDPLNDPDVDVEEDGSLQMELAPGTIGVGPAGSEMVFNNPTRPNTAFSEFMNHMAREVAISLDVNYASLTGDYSQSNYSSSRLAILDDRDAWRAIQAWFARTFLQRVFEEWIYAAMLSNAIPGLSAEEYAVNPTKFNCPKWKFRGWSWVDPAKEVQAYKEAVRNGFMTVTQVVQMTNPTEDMEDVLDERRNELDVMAEKQLVFDTDPAVVADSKATTPGVPKPGAAPDPEGDGGSTDQTGDGQGDETQQKGARLRTVK